METIEDIVRGMREVKRLKEQMTTDEYTCQTEKIVASFLANSADRIEKAYMRLEHEMNDLCDENARLRAALKPVVNCELNPIVSCALGLPNCELWLSIQECKRIFNESEVK